MGNRRIVPIRFTCITSSDREIRLTISKYYEFYTLLVSQLCQQVFVYYITCYYHLSTKEISINFHDNMLSLETTDCFECFKPFKFKVFLEKFFFTNENRVPKTFSDFNEKDWKKLCGSSLI